MIYITGDTHGESRRIHEIERKYHLKKGDTLIIAGDFGFIFTGNKVEERVLDQFSSRPYSILFLDGNHENFDLLNAYPEIEKFGDFVHEIRPNIHHLLRGRVYTIENKTFFTFGGAHSIDKAWRLAKERSTGEKIWWEQEQPNEDEYKLGIENLYHNSPKIDFIITHSCPSKVMKALGYYPDPHDLRLVSFLDMISDTVDFSCWYFGHFHEDRFITSRYRALLNDVVLIDGN